MSGISNLRGDGLGLSGRLALASRSGGDGEWWRDADKFREWFVYQ
ncbi:MAG: hypothetical protein XFASWVDF_002581, partial [Candidatus Fervidibacter sp.]